MDLISRVEGLEHLRGRTFGDPGITIAVLDGPVDLTHPCFDGADLSVVGTLIRDPAGAGAMSRRGTHVASLLFGQPGSPVEGVAPRCRGLVVPVFSDTGGVSSQRDLARAIEIAVHEGAHVINVSGGERAPAGAADSMVDRALRLCKENGVLVVAAAGSDGCPCLQVPASRTEVLPVGGTRPDGSPLQPGNGGSLTRDRGVLALGTDVSGAVPGGGTAAMTGNGVAAPIVSGVAGLLLSLEHGATGRHSAPGVRDAILDTDHGERDATTLQVGRAYHRTMQRMEAW